MMTTIELRGHNQPRFLRNGLAWLRRGTGKVKTARRSFLAAGLLLLFPGTAHVAEMQGVDLSKLEKDSLVLLQDYVQINTVNPPGNESRAVEFLSRIFDAEGIHYETAESAPGRGNIWARLQGGDEPALILLHHMDVVPADEAYWDVAPFSGEQKDGYIYGRGTLDMKSAGILHLQAFLALHRAGKQLRRDVIFIGSADEEAGGAYGAGWLAENRPEIFSKAGLLLNEGGGGRIEGSAAMFSIEVAQKVPLWLRLVVNGQPGHGSSPRVSSATTRLIRALANLQGYQFPAHIVPSVDAYFRGLALQQQDDKRLAYADIEEAVSDPDFLLQLQLENPGLHALTRNTCSITRLQGSNKINVVPPVASAEIDCRLLPDQDPDKFIQQLQNIINDAAVSIEVILSFSAAASPVDTELYQSITRVIQRHYPEAPVLPGVSGGFTDSHYFRDLGIDSYGFIPFLIPAAERAGVHGNNERISTENMQRGVRLLLEIVQEVVY